ncbi:MAG TPA: C1 family peptidase [Candidatus Binatia bacterium]|jgi:bleomycin hydrolase|nr:C1 family peptidase [Candidatus Binatia bacterium]
MHWRSIVPSGTRGSLAALATCLIATAQAETTREEILRTLERTPHPGRAEEFQPVPHFACLNQGKTSVCWSYAAGSFLESEMARLKLPSVHLSVMYPTYCQYLEKARRFIQTKGASRFNPGDLFTGVPEACQKYGALPASAYDKDLENHLPDQTRLYGELENLMQKIKRQDEWDEALVLPKVRQILNRNLGEPPGTFSFDGKTYTPKAFVEEVVRLPWSDYVMLTSFESAPFNTFTELKVPDNWHHNTNYFNVPLTVFYDAFKEAVRNGFSVAVSIDTTEPSYRQTGRYCLVLDSDVPAEAIGQTAREVRFLNGSTTDDHAIHIIGYKSFQGEDWFLAKDSWKTTWREGNHGDLFLHSSYVKLKILAFIVNRDGVAKIMHP